MYNGQHRHQQLQHKRVTVKSHLCQVNNTEDMAVISHQIFITFDKINLNITKQTF